VRHGALFCLRDSAGQILLRRRPPHGLLGGMTELPGTTWRDAPFGADEATQAAPMQAAWRAAGRVRHVFTHFELFLDVYAATVPAIHAEGFLRPATSLDAEALPSVMRKCLEIARVTEGRPGARARSL
jgi:A/G-specific adenine glycosylase